MFFSKVKSKAIATVCTPGFFTGTVVMLHSFLRHNRWFDGDILIIHEDLQPRHIQVLEKIPRVRWIPVGPTLKDQVEKLLPDYPDFKRRKGQFYSLEITRITDYESLLFIDSDILFRGNVESLFDRHEKMLACGTVKYYRPGEQQEDNPFFIERFNAGIMRFHSSLLSKTLYDTLVGHISIDFFKQFISFAQEHDLPRVGTDQLIFNWQFRDQVTLIPGSYNYRTGLSQEIQKIDAVGLDQALVIHYTGKKKPWLLENPLLNLAKGTSSHHTYSWWIEEYLDILKS